jgi:hypothetical protein
MTIYCVIPPALEDELYDRMVEYYDDDPNVKVIVDRRKSERRARGSRAPEGNKRERRDRRRSRVPGEFPEIDAVV